KLSHQLVLL
nr:Chain C, Sorting nexin 24 (127-135)(P132L) peptide [Homo sapiens]8TBV_F Chain F, Sorting nexin 24 (127-135)(P132L) peptide [Homo sapiens]8U9G_C Chain C, Sorting nexin 24 (127-135)(P132L) peptide [Homo sapiens]8U9G_F Chain F, Sorting nexin 24 (127-135)(P132L) peptide [Homo sapiens]